MLLGVLSGYTSTAYGRDAVRAPSLGVGQTAGGALPDSGSGITRDVGSIAIIEHDGSIYDDKLPDGSVNVEPRYAVAKRFYETHGDFYDFLVVFTNFEFKTHDATAFHLNVRNAELGTGIDPSDNGMAYGSPGRLTAWIDMAAVDRYRAQPFALEPGTPGFIQTLDTVAHEMGHNWLAKALYRTATGSDSADLLGLDGAHWSYLLDSDASIMYGSGWSANGDGTYTATRVREEYSPLDLYLMGFLPPEKVPPFTLLRNRSIDKAGLPVEGARISASPETVTVDQVIAALGPRVPAYPSSPKSFRAGFIFLTAPGVDPSTEDLEAVDRVRQGIVAQFLALTHGVALLDTTLAEAPEPPRALTPDLDKAFGWLLAHQSVDGRFEDSSATGIRDTQAAIGALAAVPGSATSLQRGIQWLLAAEASNNDFAARRAGGLASQALPDADRARLVTALVAQQRSDGGFGAASAYESDPLDTSLVLRALAALRQLPAVGAQRAIAALGGMRGASGAWAAVPGGDVSTVVTAQALLALEDWATLPEAQGLIPAGLMALQLRQNPDQGFGESGPSSPFPTALALQALQRGGVSGAPLDGSVSWLQAAQLEDGSWGESRFETALVLTALEGSTSPNLLVPPDRLTIDPSAPTEPQIVHVAAVVRNDGSRPSSPSRARLYDGAPGRGVAIGDVEVPALEPGGEAPVAFEYPTDGRAGDHALYVVADADGQVAESREDDNATARSLSVKGPLANLVVGLADLAVEPNPPQDGEIVDVRVTVHNLGEKAAGPFQVRLFDGRPDGGRLLGSVDVAALDSGSAVGLSFAWDTTGARGSHVLTALADATFVVPELEEGDNAASVTVEVTDVLAPGPDLAFGSLTLDPDSLVEVPQAETVRAVVRNLGTDAVTGTIALYDADPPTGSPVGQQTVSLGARSSTTLTFAHTITSAGPHTFVAVADPEQAVSETREDNNQIKAILPDPANSLDIEIRPGDVTPSSSDLVVGDVLTVTAIVGNRGTRRIEGVPVVLASTSGSGLGELARTLVTLDPGASASVSLSWSPPAPADALPLAVAADPFGLLSERDESNNRVDFSVRVRPPGLPNLAVSGADIVFEPDPPAEGQPATVSILVRNTSPTTAAGGFYVSFYRGDPYDGGADIGYTRVDGLDPLASTRVSVPWSFVDARGAQGVFAYADEDEEVEEYDETDNRAFRPFSVTGLPDIVLAAGDVTLAPGYPRAGEPVIVRATVRNLGGQPSASATLRAFEGDAAGGTIISDASIPPLAPSEVVSLEIPWTPSAPAGGRTLTLVADVDNAVVEQDEGNNVVRRSVAVQDADLYLTEPYFSPDGDGVKDETTLGYRATGPVRVVVSDSVGRQVRVLAENASSSGAVSWDGRNEAGAVARDGTYAITLQGIGSSVLGAAQVVLDTNRSPIHDAAGTDRVGVQRVTCDLPRNAAGPYWMPGGDASLFVVAYEAYGVSPGLYRLGLDGGWSPVLGDAWFEGTQAVGPDPVSPDGLEILIAKGGTIYAVPLDGEPRRTIGSGYQAAWSPDGRFVVVDDAVFSRGGGQVATLPALGDPLAGRSFSGWAWSPDGTALAAGNTVARRDDSVVVTAVVLPFDASSSGDPWYAIDTVWRGDGTIYTVVASCSDGCSDYHAFIVDAASKTAREVPYANRSPLWSPDGTRQLYFDFDDGWTKVANEDGSGALRLLDRQFDVAPRGTIGSFVESLAPGDACYGPTSSAFTAVLNLQNLTAEMAVSRLAANNGLVIRGTVSDGYLERFQLEFADQQDPSIWRPIGAASEAPVVDDVLAVWVPPHPGTYLLRLSAFDRGGNARTVVRVVSWDVTPPLVNLTQSEFLISPNGDGAKDEVRFDYLVQEPTRVDVRVVGPGDPGPTVRTLTLEYATVGPASFTWDGRDGGGAVVTDGRYTVYVNDLPLRVEIDSSPPDIAWSYQNLRAERLDNEVQVRADILWHAVDQHLRQWIDPGGTSKATQIYEAETDVGGQVIYDGALPRVKRVAGRVADARLVLRSDGFERLHATDPLALFLAEDYAGNRSELPVTPLPETVFAPDLYLPDPGHVFPLGPGVHVLLVETLFDRQPHIRFQVRPQGGATWSDLGPAAGPAADQPPNYQYWDADLLALGLSPGSIYVGRFVAAGENGERTSEEFLFRVCVAAANPITQEDPNPETAPYVKVTSAPGGLSRYWFGVIPSLPEPIASATLQATELDERKRPTGFSARAPMAADGSGGLIGSVEAHAITCSTSPRRYLLLEATLVGESGQVYRDSAPCLHLADLIPHCGYDLELGQAWSYCSSSPDTIGLLVKGSASTDAAVVVRRLSDPPVPVLETTLRPGEVLDEEITMPVTDIQEDRIRVAGTLTLPGEVVPRAEATFDAIIDRVPPRLDVLQPAETARLCLSPAGGSESGDVVVEALDESSEVPLPVAELRDAQGNWIKARATCPGCRLDERRELWLPTGRPVHLDLDVTDVPAGPHALRLTICDRAGNTSVVQRGLIIDRDPPTVRARSVAPAVFSPNGDGRADTTSATAETAETLLLTWTVRAGSVGGPVVRTLFASQQSLPGDQAVAWDGRDDQGQIVPDGPYAIVVSASDSCGRRSQDLAFKVEVDNTPPAVSIAQPASGAAIGPGSDLLGGAVDPHFKSYAVSYGEGGEPATWLPVAEGAFQVAPPLGRLGHWSTPPAPGTYTLRLVAIDQAENDAEFRTTVTVSPRLYLSEFSATPPLFSPNADGKLDSTTLRYGLEGNGSVTLTVEGPSATVLRTLEAGVPRTGGPFAVVWDGRRDDDGLVPDGDYVAHVHVEDPAGVAPPQDELIVVTIDVTPPTVAVDRPLAGSFVTHASSVHGSVTDPHLSSYRLDVSTLGAALRGLADGGQERRDADLAGLTEVADGAQILKVTAQDAAGNSTVVSVPFVLDSVPPAVAVIQPVADAVLDQAKGPVDVVGRVTDDNLESWSLAFGPGSAPAYFNGVAQGASGGNPLSLASWSVALLPDGPYTLRLTAADRAQQSAEERRTVVLDRTPPTAILRAPAEGDLVNHVVPIIGSAADANLESWKLEAAPGPAVSAYQWSPLGAGTSGLADSTLASWDPLPPDGEHTLRLTVVDRAGHAAQAVHTVTVDTTPPATPTGLGAIVARNGNVGDVTLSWNADAESDLAGYRVSRETELLTPATITETRRLDGGRPDGTYVYSVVALDKAGNASAPATLKVRVDVTPPIVAIASPAWGASVSGSVDIRGTAFSADDFKEYRLYVGAASDPTSWVLLRRSILPVSGSVLGTWLAIGDGPYTLSLEAEDLSGNVARASIPVTVDTQPPDAPVLLSVDTVATDTEALRATWTPSLAPDVGAYLLYRNGRLFNAPGVVLGDLRSYLVPPPSALDQGLADGNHCYRVVAVDEAGNNSATSNELCQILDNRPPHAVIAQPSDGSRFQFPLRIVAVSPDIDVTSVRFEISPTAADSWQPLGAPDAAAPFETTLDPASLAYGGYDIRAIATDQGGRSDPNPESITVTYGDTQPPGPPRSLAAHVDGNHVDVTWQQGGESDLAAYRVKRDDMAPVSTPFDRPAYAEDLNPGSHVYAVTAVDQDGNESVASTTGARVYALTLDQPYPVTAATTATLSGGGAQDGTRTEVLRDGSVIAQSTAAAGSFQVPAVPLLPGGNVLVARGADDLGNRSIPSGEAVLISNVPPGAVTGAAATLTDHDVDLTWDPVSDADLFGYRISRDGVPLTGTSAQTAADSIQAYAQYPWAPPEAAFDQDPGTYWTVSTSAFPVEWTVTFPTTVLVERVDLVFPDGDVAQTYRIEAHWQGRFLPLARVVDHQGTTGSLTLPRPFATDAVRVVFEASTGWVGLSEVTVERRDLASAPSFHDAAVSDGAHAYRVSAVDQYGAEGEAASVETAVGDAEPPSAPIGLAATPSGHDVALAWTPNVEPDLDHYLVFRNGSEVAMAALSSYLDRGLGNGSYSYTVVAVDQVGNESGPSNVAAATVDVPAGPDDTEILGPTDSDHPITLDRTYTDVLGRAPSNMLVALDVNGELTGVSATVPALTRLNETSLPEGSSSVAVSPDGTLVAYLLDSDGGVAAHVKDLRTGAVRDVLQPGYDVTTPLRFAPDGRRLAFLAVQYGVYRYDAFALDLVTGETVSLEDSDASVWDVAWSPDSSHVAYAVDSELWVRDIAAASSVLLATSSEGTYSSGVWSPDGTHLAVWFYPTSGAAEVHVLGSPTGAESSVGPSSGVSLPSWLDDQRVAFVSAGSGIPRVGIYDLQSGAVDWETDGASPGYDPLVDPLERWLAFTQESILPSGEPQYSVRAIDLASGRQTIVAAFPPGAWPVAELWLRDGRLAIGASQRLAFYPGYDYFFVPEAPLAPGANELVARALDPLSGDAAPDSAPVSVTVPEASFPNLVVGVSGLAAYPAVPVVGQGSVMSARVLNSGGAVASASVLLQVLDASGTAVKLQTAELGSLPPGGQITVSMPWTPSAAGPFVFDVVADPDGLLHESHEDDNEARLGLAAASTAGLSMSLGTDRASYPAAASATVTVNLANAGAHVDVAVITSVETLTGDVFAQVDSRSAALDYAAQSSFALNWNTGATHAGTYRFHARAMDGGGQTLVEATAPFSIVSDLAVAGGVAPEQTSVVAGSPEVFALKVENHATNASLDGAVARLSITPQGSATSAFSADLAVSSLLPGATWEAAAAWPVAAPPGPYVATVQVLDGSGSGAILATAHASLVVVEASPSYGGTLVVDPPDVIAGGLATARASVTNRSAISVAGLPVVVDIVDGPSGAVLERQTTSMDLAPGETREAGLSFTTAGIPPAAYPVFLRTGEAATTLARSRLIVHGPLLPPSIDSPADGARVGSDHPELVVNDASTTASLALFYEFQIFADAALQQPLPGATGIAETPSRTSWRVGVALTENATYYWRARATDGFSASAWTPVASFTVDATREAPGAPRPDTPEPGSEVATLEPTLAVIDSLNPESAALSYDFQIATDAGMASIVASATGIPEMPSRTSWLVPAVLQEGATYYWRARATDGALVSLWSLPVSFLVRALNQPPTAPGPLQPIGGAFVSTLTPTLTVTDATDPEGSPLVYRFQIDRVPTFDSPNLVASDLVPETAAETSWTLSSPLSDNTTYYWRALASDGSADGPWAGATFVVNLANDPPSVPVGLSPGEGEVVTTPTPLLVVRNSTDPDGDTLTYEFAVTDDVGAPVASVAAVAEGSGETAWTVATPLTEDRVFRWSARASDGSLTSDWSAPLSFRVDAVTEPPTAPTPVAPAEGSTISIRNPSLAAVNATSPDERPLSYSFELYTVDAGGALALFDGIDGVAEGSATTSWNPSAALPDGPYSWRVRAYDGVQFGPWSASGHFSVSVDVAPPAPAGLQATPGDSQVALWWQPSGEPDVTRYGVYRAGSSGGPYTPIATTTSPAYLDTGLANGVTVYYVVTAMDASFESGYSGEVAATPQSSVAAAEVRFAPTTVDAECLLASWRRWIPKGLGRAVPAVEEPDNACPTHLYVTIELPPGLEPTDIVPASVRIAGSVAPDPFYHAVVDSDSDGIAELRLRFDIGAIEPWVRVGANLLDVTGQAGSVSFQGAATLHVGAPKAGLWLVPQILKRSSPGKPVLGIVTFALGVDASDVDLASVRLNGSVAPTGLIVDLGPIITLQFDRAALLAVLPNGNKVPVSVSGTILGLAFVAEDKVKVIP